MSKNLNKKMATVTIDEKDYDYDDLSEESKKQINNLLFVQGEILRLQSLINVTKTSEQVYKNALKQSVENNQFLNKLRTTINTK